MNEYKRFQYFMTRYRRMNDAQRELIGIMDGAPWFHIMELLRLEIVTFE